MSKMILRSAFLGLLLVSLAALPAVAQPNNVAPGADPWVTPGNGQTFVEFGPGDVEALCGAPADPNWNHTVLLQGVPPAGVDYDTVVKRIDNAIFNSSGSAITRVQVASLAFRSLAPTNTPCGPLDWTVGLAGNQPVTQMVITRQTPRGGVFKADLVVNVELRAYKAGSTSYQGSVFYSITLPQGPNPTPWSWAPTTDDRKWIYRPGITDTEDCIAALRVKLMSYPTSSSHYYFISDMIAQGRCRKQ